MLAPRYFIYLAIGENRETRCDISSNLRIDASILDPEGFGEFAVLQPPQPIWIAEKILQQLQKMPREALRHRFSKIAPQLANEVYPQKHMKVVRIPSAELRWEGIPPPPEAAGLMEGYSLLSSEIPELLKRNDWNPPWDIEEWFHYYYLLGKVRREAAVTVDVLGLPVCRRCGASDGLIRDNCIFCGLSDCFTCTSCQTMGLAKSCTPLYYQAAPVTASGPTSPHLAPDLEFALTPPQQNASGQLEQFLDSAATQFLVWAVCGGGKTEVSFAAVAKVLAAGGNVLFAIPRKDVVQELLPRFQRAFPLVDCVALYGGSGTVFRRAPLTIATTHQCLRFYQQFDLVILDEADAFPYQGSKMLRHAVGRALKPGGKFVMMTATPEKSLLEQARNGRLPYVAIPARYHRKPLVLPEFLQNELPPLKSARWEPAPWVQHFLEEVKLQGRKALLFLPTIQLIRDYGPAITRWAASLQIPGDYVYAGRAEKDEAKRAFYAGELCFLLTSTILERGITVPNLDVLVLWADWEAVFDCRTLVQIAGRVGRSGEAARVIFAARKVSRAMKECRAWIEQLNREGYRLGYLDSGGD